MFSKSKTQIGELTRKKIEMITNESLSHEKLIEAKGTYYKLYTGAFELE